jgi:hypothetical protein
MITICGGTRLYFVTTSPGTIRIRLRHGRCHATRPRGRFTSEWSTLCELEDRFVASRFRQRKSSTSLAKVFFPAILIKTVYLNNVL